MKRPSRPHFYAWLIALLLTLPYLGCANSTSSTKQAKSTGRKPPTATTKSQKAAQSKASTSQSSPVTTRKLFAAKPARPKKSKAQLAREEWLRVAPKLVKADEVRRQALAKTLAEFKSSARGLVTSSGKKAFIDEALGLESKMMSVNDQSQHRRWLKGLFKEYVFPVSQLKNSITEHSRTLEAKLSEIDNETLVAVQADVDLDPSKLKVSTLNVGGMQNHIDYLVSDIHGTVNDSIARSVASFFVSLAGFEAGHQIARESMKDEGGNVSIFGELISIGIGVLTEEVTRNVADEVLEVRKTLDSDLSKATQSLLTDTFEGEIPNEFAAAPRRHQLAVFKAIVDSIGVDQKWAAENYYRQPNQSNNETRVKGN